jgi:CHAT domain-containing protein/Tfp pilus assembly protein PilF
VFLLALACGLGCNRQDSSRATAEDPQAVFQHAQKALQQGDLVRAQAEAEAGLKQYLPISPEWARNFRLLDAEVVLVRGDCRQVLNILDAEPDPKEAKDSVIRVLALKGAAFARLQNFDDADQRLRQAEDLCAASQEPNCGEVLRARGILLLQEGQPAKAKLLFEQTAAFARLHGDRFLEATSSLNLGLGALREQHFDEALDWTDAAYRSSLAIDAGTILTKALGNLGWAYYNLGDSEKALELSIEAEKRAIQVGDDIDQLSWATNIGYIYADRGDLARAEESYLKALDLANRIGAGQGIYNALRALALTTAEIGDLDEARSYSDRAVEIAKVNKNRLDELYPLFVKGLIAARSHNEAEAERIFHEVENDPKTNASLKFRAEYALARLYEDEDRSAAADREYQTALNTIEASRSTLKRDDSRLPFSNKARHVYDDYVHFLVATKRTNEALRWADFSRARTLAEGLGLLPEGGSVGPPPLDAPQIARRAGGTLLFYWLGEKQSYLWAITPQKTSLFTLPPGKEIDDAVRRYREALKVQDVLSSADHDGQFLYQTLIGPAHNLLGKDRKVFVIPDDSLNDLNFETLLVSEPNAPQTKLRYWIEDVTIADANSLRVLGSARAGKQKPDGTLLIVGNSVAPNDEYRELPQADVQMRSVEVHFPKGGQKILTREQATPSAYLASAPEKFSYIHFVAHGTASRLSPLDSAIVLSKESGEDNSFKLYARDIIRHPLRADLVTISACYSAGDRSYSGEGLVGLSWAFLRAGAHNVVAALWDVSDASTAQLMDKFYDELNKGAGPDAALRTAKLSLLRSKEFHNPFYWAPFQLYARLA